MQHLARLPYDGRRNHAPLKVQGWRLSPGSCDLGEQRWQRINLAAAQRALFYPQRRRQHVAADALLGPQPHRPLIAWEHMDGLRQHIIGMSQVEPVVDVQLVCWFEKVKPRA